MKRIVAVMAGLFALIVSAYAVLGCLVFRCFDPRIELELARQGGWEQAISEIEDECRRIKAAQNRDFTAQRKRKDRLRQAVRDEEIRLSHLEKDLGGSLLPHRWTTEWKKRTEARLARARRELDGFAGPKKNGEMEAKVAFLRQQVEALRSRRDRLDALIGWRDRLTIWPLQAIRRLAGKKTPTEK